MKGTRTPRAYHGVFPGLFLGALLTFLSEGLSATFVFYFLTRTFSNPDTTQIVRLVLTYTSFIFYPVLSVLIFYWLAIRTSMDVSILYRPIIVSLFTGALLGEVLTRLILLAYPGGTFGAFTFLVWLVTDLATTVREALTITFLGFTVVALVGIRRKNRIQDITPTDNFSSSSA